MQPIQHITLHAMSGADFRGFLNLLNALASKEWSVDSKASQDAFALALQAGKAH